MIFTLKNRRLTSVNILGIVCFVSELCHRCLSDIIIIRDINIIFFKSLTTTTYRAAFWSAKFCIALHWRTFSSDVLPLYIPAPFPERPHPSTEPFPPGQCCQEWVALADAEGAADLLGDDDAPEIVDAANDTCCFHVLPILLCFCQVLVTSPLLSAEAPWLFRKKTGGTFWQFAGKAAKNRGRSCFVSASGCPALVEMRRKLYNNRKAAENMEANHAGQICGRHRGLYIVALFLFPPGQRRDRLENPDDRLNQLPVLHVQNRMELAEQVLLLARYLRGEVFISDEARWAAGVRLGAGGGTS
jgi:hypothetical protein